MVRVLFIGDIVGRLGRATVGKILPNLKKRDKVDLCLANGENLAGGRGLNLKAVSEVIRYGVDYFTGGDHTFWQDSFRAEIEGSPVLRPINLTEEVSGYGSAEIKRKSRKISVVSLLGTGSPFIKTKASNPFLAVDRFLAEPEGKRRKIIIVDFHAETSSEKVALGWYLDGRVSALLGTHTHVPTSDLRILPGGTAYVTDVGMVGSTESVLGVKREIIIRRFRDDDRSPFEWVRNGPAIFNSVLVSIDEKTGKAISIERRDFEVD